MSGTTARQQLSALLPAAARLALPHQRADGSMPAGHNGPYKDRDTPVRNTAHWSITFIATWRQSGDSVFRLAAERAADYLVSPAAWPQKCTFHCRNNTQKDETNGLIGQAWAIEALVELGVQLDRPDLLDVAEHVFCLHPYEHREGGWRRVTLGGKPIDFDRTFNHQLWFCAAGALLVGAGVERPAPVVRAFVSRIPHHMKLYPSGLIRHVTAGFLAKRPADRVVGIGRLARNTWHRKALRIKSVGYHAFNTYALALIERALPETGVGRGSTVMRALNYLRSRDYYARISASPYGFAYNPPGFEAAVTIDTFFPDSQHAVDGWIRRQLAESYNSETGQVNRGVADPATSAARLYEVNRLTADWRVSSTSNRASTSPRAAARPIPQHSNGDPLP